MPDLNVMLLEHARSGLNTQLETATTNGDFEAVKKINAELVKLEVAATPAAPTGYGEKEIRAELDKLDWFGTDPKKSAKAVELGKTMNPKKFGTAAEFAAALVKAVDEEFKKPAPETGNDEIEDDETENDETGKDKTPPKPRRSDAPSDGDAGGTRTRRTTIGPWVKISDAPPETQKEINRTADKFAPKTEDGRKKYVAKALEAHYNTYLRNKGKK